MAHSEREVCEAVEQRESKYRLLGAETTHSFYEQTKFKEKKVEKQNGSSMGSRSVFICLSQIIKYL